MIKKETSWINPLVIISNSLIQNKGMFAKEDVKKGTIIFKWGGTFVTNDEMKKFDRSRFILIQVEDNLWSVEPRDKPEDETYFINHSCNPNVWMKNGITFITKKNIKKGEELTVDYAMFEDEDYVAKWDCNCGSKFCRHKITGKDYLLPELQKR